MESFATAYPVIFNDGEQDHDKGHVGVHSVLSFKKFQAQMSRLVGIPANQLSAVFVCRRTLKDTDKRQKLPISETTNFNIILNQHNPSRERDCHFLVSLKKPKKERKGTRRRNTEAENGEDEDSTSSRGDISPLEERPKQEPFDKFSEATSPTSILQGPLSPLVSPSDDGQHSVDTNRKVLAGTSDKVERILLRRDAAPQEKFPQRVEGFNLPVVSPPGVEQHRRCGAENWQGAMSKEVIGNVMQPVHPVQGEAYHPQRLDDFGTRPRAMLSVEDGSTNRLNMVTGGNLVLRGITNGVQQPSGGPPRANYQSHISVVNQEGMQIIQPAGSQKPCRDCLFCKENNTRPPAFHCCINDRILVGFRRPSPAGPIQRPVKRHVEASA